MTDSTLESAPKMALVCLGEVPWDRSWKRNQSMVFELSHLPLFDRVVFINPRGVWIKDHLVTGTGRFQDRLRSILRSAPRADGKRVWICSMLHFVPLKRYIPWGIQLEDRVLALTIRLLRWNKPYVLLNNHPSFFSTHLLEALMHDAALSVFDLSDDFVEFHEVAEHRAFIEKSVQFSCSHSDVVFAVNDHVRQKYGAYNPNTYVVPNATNFWNFQRAQYAQVPALEKLRAQGGPILGHTGTINRLRVDYELLEALVQQHSRWQFVFIGGADPSFLAIVQRYANLHHFQHVDYNHLPDWVHYFDVGIVPFRVNEHTKGNDLLKFNDYLAMGKSIVTTNMGGAHKYGDLLWVASGAQEFAACIERALQGSSAEIQDERMAVARKNSWKERALDVHSILQKHLQADAR